MVHITQVLAATLLVKTTVDIKRKTQDLSRSQIPRQDGSGEIQSDLVDDLMFCSDGQTLDFNCSGEAPCHRTMPLHFTFRA